MTRTKILTKIKMERIERKNKVYSYIRLSSVNQIKGRSKIRQKETTDNYVLKNDLGEVEYIIDEGVSGYDGSNIETGNFGKFLIRVKNNQIEKGSYLLVESFDRISRENALYVLSIFSNIIDHDITVITLDDNGEYNKKTLESNPGILYTAVGSILKANSESRTKSIRISEAWRNKRNNINKKPLTAKCPSWLKLNQHNNKYEIIPSAVETIKYIYQLAINGYGYGKITSLLNEQKREPIGRVNHWNKSYIEKILNNRQVIGEFQPHILIDKKRIKEGEPIINYYPQIINEIEFEKARRIITSRKIEGGGRKGKVYSNLFTHILFCKLCGAPMNYINKGDNNNYLICRKVYQKEGCNNKSWRYNDFEKTFLKYITEISFEGIISDGESTVVERINTEIENNLLIIKKAELEQGKIERVLLDEIIDGRLKIKYNKKHAELCIIIDKAYEKINNLQNEIEIINMEKAKDSQNEIKYYTELLNNTEFNDSKLFEIRAKLSAEIKAIIKKIQISNCDFKILPCEWNLLSTECLRDIKRRGFKTEEELESFLETTTGKKLVNEYEQHFIASYNNGATRLVYPKNGLSLKSTPPNIKINKIRDSAFDN